MTGSHNSFANKISYALAAAHRSVNTSLSARLKKHGLQIEAWRIMETLENDDRLRMGELAKVVLINPPTLSKLVDRMVLDGLVHRQVSHRDHRQINLLLTDLGRKRMMQIRGEVEEQDREIEDRLGPGKAHELIRLLNELH
ncbi:MarR family transcriptional regulator [Aestuariivita sp.]|jgi:DNA-binding MarR family transcriptional regulator|uniref:MarR family winged helix-turn-helix transcriptional regulator n=1 Tax=Aestuariivita sp. TaxID=1872407 RepID=UPI0021707D3A|nr:MarR family transcriptional regulator [Aestuariivita sp.]MCE8007535.1 MarR family transcriptional regulator [Aestuariivita sp.]